MKRFLLILPFLLLASPSWGACLIGSGVPAGGVGLSVSDDFNRADNVDLGANWEQESNLLQISSNGVKSQAGVLSIERWSADTFAENQKACMTVTTNANGAGILARLSNSALTYYYASTDGTTLFLKKRVDGGTATTLNSAVNDVSGDTVCISATGTSTTALSVSVNGSEVLTASDSSSPITSGNPGIFVYSDTAKIDDFAAEEL